MTDYFIYDVATNAEFTEFVIGYRNRIELAESITLSNLIPNSTYYFRIAYVKDGIKTPYSVAVINTDAIPTTTTTTATNITSTGFRANFNVVADRDSYEVDLLNSSNVVLNTVTTTNNYYDFTDLSSLTIYKYRVRVVISGYESENSNVTSLTTASSLPDVPTNLVTSSITSTGFTATWGNVDTATSYDISIDDGTAINVMTNTYNSSGLSSGITHTWKVRAKNGAGNSNYTSNQNILLKPATPTGLAVSTYSTTTATIIWNASTGATSYKLYIKLSGTPITGYNGKVITGTSESVTGLSGNTTYTIEVIATNSSGDSALSGSISFKTTIEKILGISNSTGTNYYYLYNSDGTNKTKLTSNNTYAEGSNDFWGRISTNGRYIAYSRQSASSAYALFIYDLQTNTEIQVSAVGSNTYGYPAWKPDDNSNIYCWKNFGSGSNVLVRINISTFVETVMYTPATSCYELDFQNDSSHFIFRFGSTLGKVRTSDWAQIGFSISVNGAICARFNADNSKILYSKLSGGVYQTHICNLDGSTQTQVVFNGTNCYNVLQQKITPNYILYSYHQGNSDMQIWRMSSTYTENAVFINSASNNDGLTDSGVLKF